MTGEIADLTAGLRKAHPRVGAFLDELNQPARSYPVLGLSASSEFLLAATGAALETRGWHLVVFPGRHADHRVEAIRLALRSAAAREENTTVVTKAASAVGYAVEQEKSLKDKTHLVARRTLEELPDPANVGGHGCVLIDFDSLGRDTSLADVKRAVDPAARSVVLVGTRTEYRLVAAAGGTPGVHVVALSEAQLLASEDLPAHEASLTAGWDWVPSAQRGLPRSFADVNDRVWMKPLWRTSRYWRSAVYRGLATAIMRRDLMRATRVSRELVVASAPTLEASLAQAAEALARAQRALRSVGDELTASDYSLVSDLTDHFYRLRALAVSVKAYDKVASKLQGHLTFSAQQRELVNRASRVAGLASFGEHVQASIDAITAAQLSLAESNAKTPFLVRLAHNAVETHEPLTMVVNDEVEVSALSNHFQSFVRFADGEKATRAKMVTRGITIVPVKALRTLEAHGRLVLANLPPYWLAREAYVRGVGRVTAVAYASERDRYAIIQARDRIVETRLCSPKRQEAALSALVGAPTILPPTLRAVPPLDEHAVRALEVVKQLGQAPLPSVLDQDEFYAEEDAFSRAMRRRAADVAREGERGETAMTSRGATVPGVRVHFKDGSFLECEPNLWLDLIPDDERTEATKPARRLERGDLLLVGEEDASQSTISSIAGRLQAKTPRAIETVELNNAWRLAIDVYRRDNNLSWWDLLEDCKENGYTNNSSESLMSYVAPWVWLPDSSKKFEAILRTVSPTDLYIRRQDAWEATARLRRISGRLKRTLKAEYRRRAAGEETTLDSDALLDEEWGVRMADFEDLFVVKEVDHIEEGVTFRYADRGRIKWGAGPTRA